MTNILRTRAPAMSFFQESKRIAEEALRQLNECKAISASPGGKTKPATDLANKENNGNENTNDAHEKQLLCPKPGKMEAENECLDDVENKEKNSDKAQPLIHILEFQGRLIMEDPDLHKHVEVSFFSDGVGCVASAH